MTSTQIPRLAQRSENPSPRPKVFVAFGEVGRRGARALYGMQGESRSGPFYGVFDRQARCIAVSQSPEDAMEAARERLGLDSTGEVSYWCRLLRISGHTYERHLKAGR